MRKQRNQSAGGEVFGIETKKYKSLANFQLHIQMQRKYRLANIVITSMKPNAKGYLKPSFLQRISDIRSHLPEGLESFH